MYMYLSFQYSHIHTAKASGSQLLDLGHFSMWLKEQLALWEICKCL